MQESSHSNFAMPAWLNLRPLWFWIPTIALVALRFLHFGELIDEPHGWRQADTAQYAWSFYKGESTLLHPQVCWMGSHKTTILEFPLHEAITGLLYRIFWPGHVWCRLVTLAFFLGSAIYLHKIIRLVSTETHAHLAVLFYLAMPLSQFYSRALHIDFTAVCLAHGMAYHWMVAIRSQRQIHWAMGFLMATLAFPVKAPYAFYLALPLLAFILHEKRFVYALKNLHWLLAPVGIFMLWQMHVERVNSAVPDYSQWLGDFHPFSSKYTFNWYFGTWEQRMDPENWRLIWMRFREEIAGGSAWIWPLAAAILLRPLRFGNNFFRLWLLGTFIYLLIFFNLNVVHNYYQIPFLAITAVMMGHLAAELKSMVNELSVSLGPAFAFGVILTFSAFQIRTAEKLYYDQPLEYFQTGAIVQQFTPEDAILILSRPDTDSRTPMFLYHSHRHGWQVNPRYLSVATLRGLITQGATHYVAMINQPPAEDLLQFLAPCPRRLRAIRPDLAVQVYDLAPLRGGSAFTSPLLRP